MRRSASLTLFLALLSVISGYMLSNGSWIGRVGMDLFHDEYSFLNTWWQGALLVFAVLIFLYVLQSVFFLYTSRSVSQVVNIIALLAAIVGLYLTYDDFRSTLSHRWMGERFHIGAYLFWIGWMIISIYLMLNKKNARALNRKVGVDV
jgi:hypothetical protein